MHENDGAERGNDFPRGLGSDLDRRDERGGGARILAAVSAALADAAALVFPVECAACGEPDVVLCEACRAALAPVVEHRVLESGVAVWSGLRFDGAAARVVRALKEDGRTALARPLGAALRAAITACAAGQRADGGVEAAIRFACVPTSRAAFRRRGFRVVDTIARCAGVPTAALLVPARATADQRALGRADRVGNVEGSLRARDAARLRVVILDDVVTTGATIDEATRALRAAGAVVVGAATVAATPLVGKRRVTTSQTHT